MTAEPEMHPPVEGVESDSATQPSAAGRGRDWWVPALLAIVLLVQLLTSVRQLSQTSDEANHLHAGYRYWQCGDFGYDVEVPPLAKLVAALPLRFMTVRDPFSVACGISPASDYVTGRQFLYAGNADRLLAAGRAAVSVFAMATLLLAWFWTRAMFGRTAASIAAILIAFEPNFLAHGALVTTDVALTFGILASTATFWFCARQLTWTRIAAAGVAIGLALTSKFSAIAVVPILIVLLALEWFVRRHEPAAPSPSSRAVLAAITAVCLALMVVWAAYGFRYLARPGGGPVRFTRADWEPAAPRLLPLLLKTHILPEGYVIGLGHVMLQAQSGQPTYLFGRLYGSGRWFYFPAVLLVKLTLPVLLLAALASVFPWWLGRGRDALYTALPAILFLLLAMRSHLDIGVRHVLPVIVFVAIAAGAAASAAIDRRPAVKWAVGALLLFHVVTSLRAFPSYISYANELWGGPSGAYRQVTDSNTDWGQALRQVARRASAAGSPCWVLSPYQIPLAYYGVLCRDLRVETAGRISGTVFVSSTARSGALAQELDYDPGEVFRGRIPTGTVGGSAFLVYEGDFDLRTNLSLVYNATAQLLLTQGRAREAIEYAQHASQLRPDAGTPHFVACSAEFAANAPDIAKHECAEAVRLLERSPDFNRRMLDAVQDFVRRNGL